MATKDTTSDSNEIIAFNKKKAINLFESLYKNDTYVYPLYFKYELEACINNRRKYFVMSKINVLAILQKLPNELCDIIIDFANYKYEAYISEYDGFMTEEPVCEEVDNSDERFSFEYDWKTFLKIWDDFIGENENYASYWY